MNNKLGTMNVRNIRPMPSTIKDVLNNDNDRWEEYAEEIFDDSRRDRPEDVSEQEGHSILRSEVTAALRRMKDKKAPGNDCIWKEITGLW